MCDLLSFLQAVKQELLFGRLGRRNPPKPGTTVGRSGEGVTVTEDLRVESFSPIPRRPPPPAAPRPPPPPQNRPYVS